MQYGAVERSKDVINTHVLSSTLNFGKDGRSVSGGNVLSAWLKREVYFTLAFQRRWKSKRILPKRDPREKAQRVEFVFDLPDDGILEARIAVSTVDAANARRNLLAEGKTSFEQCREAAAAEWNGLLSRADIKGAGAEERKIFKTGLYHLFIQPNDIADVDGRYRGADGKVHVASSGCYYTGFSLWDTFRAAHPLYTVLTPEKVDGFVNSMLEQYRAVGYLPVIPYFGSETFCMIGNHSVPVIVDAYLKGFRGFDAALAFEAVTNSLTVTHPGKIKEDWKYYDTLGYYPYDVIKGEGVSRTMECAYDDSCAARFAAALGKDAVREFFSTPLKSNPLLFSALSCQIISNVPSAILLSQFTDNYRELLLGVNIGGTGTLIASLASLITFRSYTMQNPGKTLSYIIKFSAFNFAFLAILLVFCSII
jgi:putative alpha-1,2-mannosidase